MADDGLVLSAGKKERMQIQVWIVGLLPLKGH